MLATFHVLMGVSLTYLEFCFIMFVHETIGRTNRFTWVFRDIQPTLGHQEAVEMCSK